MIVCNNVEQLVEVKTTKKNWGTQFGPKRAKIRPKIRFFAIFSSLFYQFSFKLHRMIAWNNVDLNLLVDLKRPKYPFEVQIWAKWAKIGPKIRFLSFFQVWFLNSPSN